MANDAAALTPDVTHKIIRGLLLGQSLNGAFRSAGVEPEVGYGWIRHARDEEYHRRCYMLRRVVEESFDEFLVVDGDIDIGVAARCALRMYRSDGNANDAPSAWLIDNEGQSDMGSDKTVLDDVIIHKVVREAYRGSSVDEAFELACVDPALGRKWLREGGKYESRRERYVLRDALDNVFRPENQAKRERCALTFPANALWVGVLDKVTDMVVKLLSR